MKESADIEQVVHFFFYYALQDVLHRLVPADKQST